MLKIFLVEDEFVVREGIKNNIDWGSHGYGHEVSCSASHSLPYSSESVW